jgi:hypothetical protein
VLYQSNSSSDESSSNYSTNAEPSFVSYFIFGSSINLGNIMLSPAEFYALGINGFADTPVEFLDIDSNSLLLFPFSYYYFEVHIQIGAVYYKEPERESKDNLGLLIDIEPKLGFLYYPN